MQAKCRKIVLPIHQFRTNHISILLCFDCYITSICIAYNLSSKNTAQFILILHFTFATIHGLMTTCTKKEFQY